MRLLWISDFYRIRGGASWRVTIARYQHLRTGETFNVEMGAN